VSVLECPDDCELSEFLLGDLDEKRFARLDSHIEACLVCQKRIETLPQSAMIFDQQVASDTPLSPFCEEVECLCVVERIQQFANGSLRDPTPRELVRERPQLPELLGPYRILEQIGQGGMGTVYKALHTRLNRIVAIKVLPRQLLSDPQTESRFRREMEVIGALDHPNIVRASDADERDGVHYLVMDFIDGLDLSQLVRIRGPLRVADACELVCQAAEGLQYAHERGLIHRDIKPSNIMLTSGATESPSTASFSRTDLTANQIAPMVKILDFGLARWNSTDVSEGELTSEDQLMGTLDYMAPEQATDTHRVDTRADIYSLGAALWKLLTGQSPLDSWGEVSRLKKLLKLASANIPSVKLIAPHLPPKLVYVIDSMLDRDPARRPATPSDVVKLLRPFTRGANLAALLRANLSDGAAAVEGLSRSAVPSGLGSVSTTQSSYKTRLYRSIAVTLAVLGLSVLAFLSLKSGMGNAPSGDSKIDDSKLRGSTSVVAEPVVKANRPPMAVAPFDAKVAGDLQRSWADFLEVPVEMTNAIGMTFRLIPPGEFLMGSNAAEIEAALQIIGGDAHWQRNIRSEGPQHAVRLSQAFYLGTTSVTQEQFELIVGSNPAYFRANGPGKNDVAGVDTRRFPVESMTFAQATEFCQRLTQRESKAADGMSDPGVTQGYRLPTESEWEFACRAGTITLYWCGNLESELDQVALTSKRIGPRPNSVGLLRPNPFGLYDVHGNIFDLCQDWWTPQYPDAGAKDPLVDPQGAATGTSKVARGGDWSASAFLSRSATRAAHTLHEGNYYCGFRVALSVDDFRRLRAAKQVTIGE
jgi:serine/threonine protein kinase